MVAFIRGLDLLRASVPVDAKTATRHDPDRQLIGQGLGDIASGLLCGLPVSHSFARAAPAFDAGARRRPAEYVASGLLVVVLVLLVVGRDVLAVVPLTVIAAAMLTVALVLIDGRTRRRFGQLRATGTAREHVYQVATVVVVAAFSVGIDFVTAVAAGVVLAMNLFVLETHHSLVHAVRTGATIGSRRDYPPGHAAMLRQHGHRICVLDREGALFFGTGDRLGAEVERHAAQADAVIPGFARVTGISQTAVQMLPALDRRLAGKARYFAHLLANSRRGPRDARVGPCDARPRGALVHRSRPRTRSGGTRASRAAGHGARPHRAAAARARVVP